MGPRGPCYRSGEVKCQENEVESAVLETAAWGVTDCWHRRCPRLRSPELGPVIQRMDQLGCQLDVIAHYLFVLCNAVDVADTTSQVSVHTGAQFTFPELERTQNQKAGLLSQKQQLKRLMPTSNISN